MSVAKNSDRPDVLMTGILMGECPRWHDGRLWFADWVAETLYTVSPDGQSEAVAKVASLPFSFDWTPAGDMLLVNARRNLLQRRLADGSFTTVADLGILSSRGCNEIVVDGRGNAYVNNIDFDFPGGEFRPGFVALVTPEGAVRRVAEGLAFPNGMAVTAEGRTLIVAESYGSKLTAFDIQGDGSLSGRRVWADVPGFHPDGICLDADGAIWFADVPNRKCLRVAEGGKILDMIEADRGCFACMLGGADGRTLFILANAWSGPEGVGAGATGQVLTVRAPAPHAGFP